MELLALEGVGERVGYEGREGRQGRGRREGWRRDGGEPTGQREACMMSGLVRAGYNWMCCLLKASLQGILHQRRRTAANQRLVRAIKHVTTWSADVEAHSGCYDTLLPSARLRGSV